MDSKSFFYDFGKAIYHVDAFYEDYAQKSKLAPTLLWIMYALNDGNPHTQREICVDWELPKSTVNTIITDLKKNGYVELAPIKGKRREMAVSLTECGKAYADNILKPLYIIEADVFRKLGQNERNVIESLEKIVKYLREKDA